MPAPRLCPHCNRPITGRCQPCRTLRYGKQHQAERIMWEPLVATGSIACARGGWCGEPHLLDPREAWHLDHIDGERRPSCALHNDRFTGR